MIKIFKDKDVKVVTKGAYESFYKPLGYNTMNDKKEVKPIEKSKSDNEIKKEIKEEISKEVNKDKKSNESTYNKRK